MEKTLRRLRELTEDAMRTRSYESAMFYAEKAITLQMSSTHKKEGEENHDVNGRGGGGKEGGRRKGRFVYTAHTRAVRVGNVPAGAEGDVFALASAFYETGQYDRTVHTLDRYGLLDSQLGGLLLGGRAYYAAGKMEEVLELIGEEQGEDEKAGVGGENASTIAALAVLRAQVYEDMENRDRAGSWYLAAMEADYHCVDAFEVIVRRQLLAPAEEEALLESLPFAEDEEWLRLLYKSKLNTRFGDNGSLLSSGLDELAASGLDLTRDTDVLVARARAAYDGHSFDDALALAKAVLDEDPYHAGCLPLYIATLVETHAGQELFRKAHALADEYPDSALSWYAVGCYYYAVGDNGNARTFFSRATALDGNFGAAWIGFGHSFAAEAEHDQAMAAYRTAARLCAGSHLPNLFVGMEYAAIGNINLADQFIQAAHEVCAAADPLVLNELGVIATFQGDYDGSRVYLERALLVGGSSMEAVVFNLAGVCRKLGDLDAAIEYYSQALALRPREPSTYTGLGFTYMLRGDLDVAIEYFHKSLGVRPDDTLTEGLLALALADAFVPGFHDSHLVGGPLVAPLI